MPPPYKNMRLDIYKVTQYRDLYLGFIERDTKPKKGEVINFLGHSYKVDITNKNGVFVKLIN